MGREVRFLLSLRLSLDVQREHFVFTSATNYCFIVSNMVVHCKAILFVALWKEYKNEEPSGD